MKKMHVNVRENLNSMAALGERLKNELVHRGRGAEFFSYSLRS